MRRPVLSYVVESSASVKYIIAASTTAIARHPQPRSCPIHIACSPTGRQRRSVFGFVHYLLHGRTSGNGGNSTTGTPDASKAGATVTNSVGNNEAPRPEAEVSGRPPRGGRFRGVAPVGGVDVNLTRASPDRSAEATPNSRSEGRGQEEHPEKARRIARSSSGHTARGRGFIT